MATLLRKPKKTTKPTANKKGKSPERNSAANGRSKGSAIAMAEAINKSQAVIEFELDGTVVTAN